ncbi:MAG: MarR family winged helix-turn-helix transcriptional regulator [Steroidobacteraceae bacterium]
MPRRVTIAEGPLQLSRLIGRLRAEIVSLVERELDRSGHGLTFTQFLALKLLGEDTPMTPVALARALHYSPGALTRLLDGLQERKFLSRRPDPSDRRAIRLELTATGKAMRRQTLEVCAVAAERAFACLTAQEQDTLHALLARVLDQVQQPT